ncbi:MAG: hypothetical protein HUU41_02785 [Bryobacteraceae bacterium]|nr:hypothetical protein [Bryobacterales bacterium]MEB2362254.1 hypothetical protein [Bryobacterales bacterium]NUN00016.1 hypothetical protein [Bryobacteraceae bacterium]
MTEQNELLERILASRYFARAETRKRILRFIVERSAEPGSVPLNEYEIAVECLGRSESFNPKVDPIVRVSMTSIRRRLDTYFEAEGGKEPLRLRISKGRYRAVYAPNEKPRESATKQAAGDLSPALEKFWRPHLASDAATLVVYSEPLFLCDAKGLGIRHAGLNNPETAADEIVAVVPRLGGSALTPCYPYVSAGTMYCVIALTRIFLGAGVPLEVKPTRLCAWQQLLELNLVLVGILGTNSFLRALQGHEDFVLEDDCIRNGNPQPDESPVYCGERYLDGSLPRHRQYAVVTRRPGLAPGRTITMIGAFHGKAIDGAAQLVTTEHLLDGVLQRLTAHPGADLPERFQLLAEVEMVDIGDDVANVRCLAHRIMPAHPA